MKRKNLYTSLIFDYLSTNLAMKKNQLPQYLTSIISKYPEITSGRKNYLVHHQRIIKQIQLIEKYFKKKTYNKL
tara:strand:+ start:2795 stop:3016 length:222 start_codon:yes stop_codon:yes gene_type:complete